MQRLICVALVVLGAFPFAAGPLGGQAHSQSQKPEPPPSPLQVMERDIAARSKTLLSESKDLGEIAKWATGTEVRVAETLDQRAMQGVMELESALGLIRVYEKMQCEPDREVAKAVLKDFLRLYSPLLDVEADGAAGDVAFTRLPAAAQAGQRIKEDLRAAKNKLDEVAASLK